MEHNQTNLKEKRPTVQEEPFMAGKFVYDLHCSDFREHLDEQLIKITSPSNG